MTARYLHVIHSLNPEGGGTAEGVKQLVAAAVRLKHRVEIVTLDAPHGSWTREVACPVHCVGPSFLKYGYAPRFAPWLRANAERFDAIVVNGIWQYHGFATWRMLRGSTLPYYVFTHGMLDPWFKRRYPLKHVKKLLYWPWAEYRVLRDACGVLFTSEEERLQARHSFGRYRAEEIVVNYGIPGLTGDATLQREMFLREFPHLQGKRLILFLGRIHPKKGCDLLLEAFASVAHLDRSLQLVMAGPDPMGMRPQLTELAERLGVGQSVTWTDMLRGELKTGAFRAAEAFILPSHQENFGIAVTEALSCGVPVLISDKVNIWREIVADGAGLAADDSVRGTRQLLQDWLALGHRERELMGRNAVKCFAQRFHVDIVATKLLTIFASQGEPRKSLAA